MIAAISWSIASALTRKLPLPASKAMSSGAQMLAGGILLAADRRNFWRVPRISHLRRFSRRLVRACLLDRRRLHRRIHRLCLADPSSIANQSWHLCLRQSRSSRNSRIFSRRRDRRPEDLAGNAAGSRQRDRDHHHPRQESGGPAPAEFAARRIGRTLANLSTPTC